jgi:putative tryptophan/tyrosine transport system ATP-binding protein
MLKLKNITVSFNNTPILRDFSGEIHEGDFIVIVGANGTGKSTLFDTLAGKTKPQSGSILLDTTDITHLNEQQRAHLITRIFQKTELNSVGSFTVAQNLALAQYSRRSARLVDGMQAMPRERAEQIIQELGMNISILDRPMRALSGGQRQLIAFAMSTQQIPKVLLLDEPTAALDPHAATRLLVHATQFIKQYKVTTLLITHDPNIALAVGNKIWILDNGKIAREYSAQDRQNLTADKLMGHIDYALLNQL